MSDQMIPKIDVPADEYHEDPDYNEENDTVDPNTQGDGAHDVPEGSVQTTTDTNFSGSVETSVPDEGARRDDQK